MKRFYAFMILFTGLVLIKTNISFGQETTSTFNGIVTDNTGTNVAGASIIIKHLPTGFVTGTTSNRKGIFIIPNLKPGGPYNISISYVDHAPQLFENINLSLGNNAEVNIVLKPNNNSLTEVVVTSTAKKQTGGLSVGKTQLNTLPTLGRSLSDFTRLTPQSNNNSFAGSNFRYNNLTVDGAINNDAIGFSNSLVALVVMASQVPQVAVPEPILIV